MRRRLQRLLCLVPLLAAGCLTVEQDLLIKEDGSGVFTLKYALSENTVQQIEGLRKLQRELDAAAGRPPARPAGTDFSRLLFNPVLDELKAKLKEYEAYGISQEEFEVKSRDGQRQVQMKLLIGDLAQAAQTDVFRQFGFSLQKNTAGNYVLERRPHVAELPEGVRFDDPQTVRLLAPLLGGLSIGLSVTTPGKIVSTTAPTRGPYNATWRYEFDRNPAALTALLSQHFLVVFEGAGLRVPEIRLGGAGGHAPAAAPADAARP